MRRVRFASALLTLAGCATDFVEPWEVTEPRLLAARVEVEGNPDNPRPRLGQTFALRQFIALPGPLATPLPQRYSMDVALCLGLKTTNGELGCIGEQELESSVQAISETEILLSGLNLDLAALGTSLGLPLDQLQSLPPELLAQLSDLDRLALFGVLCVEGRAERVPGKSIRTDQPSQLFRCVPNEGAQFKDANTFILSVLLDRGLPGDANLNPSFACDPLATDSVCTRGLAREGEPLVPGSILLAAPKPEDPTQPRQVVEWRARDPNAVQPWEGCAGDPNLPQILAGSSEVEIRFRFDPSDRETYQNQVVRNGQPTMAEAREGLLLSHALTTEGGELEGHFAELRDERADAEGEITIEYTPPALAGKKAGKPIPQNGRLVRFYFTLRDQRGGVDFTTRELCLLPGE
jgi:hypothetical protein